MLGEFEPAHLLVGHGAGVHGAQTTSALHDAIHRSRRHLLRLLASLPFSGRA